MSTPPLPDDALAAMRRHVPAEPAEPAALSAPTQRFDPPGEPMPEQAFPQQDDYFGFAYEERFMFPDGASWVAIKKLTEGDRRKYLNRANRKLSIKKVTGDAELNMAAGEEKHLLLETAIVNWNLKRGGEVVPFNNKTRDEFLERADPKLIDSIEAFIRKINPWLTNDASIEDIEREIEQLQEVLATKRAEEEGKDTSEK